MTNLRKKMRLVVLLLSILCALTSAYAQISPSNDAYTDTASPTTNFGAKAMLDVQSASQNSYILFDLSEIPAGYTGSNITKATLKLYVNAVTGAGSFNVDFVNGAWTEKAITSNLAPALGAAIAASVPLSSSNVHDYVNIDVTTALQAWLNGSQANDGIALVGNSPLNASFDSKESTTQSHPPELDVVFAAGGGITGITTANGSGLMGGGTSGVLNLSLINTCANTQVLQWNGSKWVCASAGTGTITGVAAGADLTGGGTSGNVTVNVDTTKVPQLATANTFTGNQTVNGNLSATGVVSGSSYQIGSNLFAFGSPGSLSAFLGFAGNTTTSGVSNTAVGVQALLSNTDGFENTAIGVQALADNTDGTDNTASGAWALFRNTTGNANAATGAGALYANTTGFYNTANGKAAMAGNTTGNNNSAVGYASLLSNTTGGNNTGMGYDSLFYDNTGSNNTAVGYQAGRVLDSTFMTTNNNTFVGANAVTSAGTLTNASAIGANAEVTVSNAMVLGSINGVNSATADTFVGVGTTAPKTLLHVDHNPPPGGQDIVLVTSGGSSNVASLLVQNTAPGLRLRVGVGTDSAYLATSGGMKFFTADTGTPNTPTGPVMTIDTAGNVHIAGNLSKGGGSFKIDHPLDPANKYLSHSFVESPDMMNIYNGNVVTDKRGLATIDLPEWFEALNRDFRYQLTVLRQFAQAIVVNEVSNHRFTIKTSKPGVKVSWQVTGIRQDPYANAYRIPLEEVKAPGDQGHYLHPELFGAGPEKSVGVRAPKSPVVSADQTAALAPSGRTTQKQ